MFCNACNQFILPKRRKQQFRKQAFGYFVDAIVKYLLNKCNAET